MLFGDVVDGGRLGARGRRSRCVDVRDCRSRRTGAAPEGGRSSDTAGHRPFVDQGLDEALGLAVGLRSIGPGPLVPDVGPARASPARVASIARAVVGEHALDPDPDLREPGDRRNSTAHGRRSRHARRRRARRRRGGWRRRRTPRAGRSHGPRRSCAATPRPRTRQPPPHRAPRPSFLWSRCTSAPG